MNLDDNTLSLLAIQMLALTLVGCGVLLLRISAATRVWCIRLLIVSLIGLACASQLPLTRVLPTQRPIMIPAQADAVTSVNRQLERVTILPKDQPGDRSYTISAFEIWSAGVLIGLIWAGMAALDLRRLRKYSTPCGEFAGTELRVSSRAASPLVAGVIRPILYLPEGASARLSPEELKAVFAHELAHIEHRDLRWKALHRMACILLWPNVVLWLLLSPHDRAMEELADAKACQAAVSREVYAALLLSIAKHRLGRDAAFSLAMTPKHSNIGKRIRRVLSGEPLRELALPRGKVRLGIVLAAALAMVLTLAGFGWQRATGDAAEFPWQKLSGNLSVHLLGPDGQPAVRPQAWLTFNSERPAEVLTVDGGWVKLDRSRYSPTDGPRIVARDASNDLAAMVIKNGAPSVDLSLKPTAILRGQCVQVDGRPVAGVHISIYYCGIPGPEGSLLVLLNGPFAIDATTDREGFFSLRGVPRNSVLRLNVADPTLQQPIRLIKRGDTTYYGFEVGDAPVTDLGRIVMQPAGQVSGRVAANGHGVGGIRVIAQSISGFDGKEAGGGETHTDADGHYVIGGLGNASYNIEVYLPSDLARLYACAAKEALPVKRGRETGNQDFDLVPGGLIEGRVILRSHADPEGYPVAYYNADHPKSSAACGGTRCDSKGHFTIRVSPGDQYVYLQCAAGGRGVENLSVASGQTVHVTLRE